MTTQEVVQMLGSLIASNDGSQSVTAGKLGVSKQYMNDVIRCRREPGKKILDALGLERVVQYQERQKGE